MLPDGDGIEFARCFRREGYANPLMILTARETTAEKVKALDAGADDYVVKPFDFDELCARIRALLRRENNGLPTVLSWGALQLDPSTCKTTYDGNAVRLTPKEFSMLELFLRHPYRIYSLGAIIEDLWSFEDPPGEDAVRTHIKGLRRKLKAVGAPKDLIKTIYGLGYQLNESNENAAGEKVLSDDDLSLKSLHGETVDREMAINREAVAAAESSVAAASIAEAALPESSILEQRITEACSRYLSSVSEQMVTLECLLQALSDGTLTPDLYQQALVIAHNLAGSLGSFGFAEGSKAAQMLETQLRELFREFSRELPKEGARDLSEEPSEKGVSKTVRVSKNANEEVSPYSVSSQQISARAIAQLSQSVQYLHQLTQQATKAASADVLSDRVQVSFPVLLIVSGDSEFAESIAAIAPQAHLQTQQVSTLQQAPQRLISERCDLLLVDVDSLASDGSDDDTLSAENMQLIQQFKQDYRLPVMVTAYPQLLKPLALKQRLALIQKGIDVVSDRTTEPLQIALAAAAMIRSEGHQGRVAIADDDPDMLTLFQTSLEPWGFQIFPFESASALWHWLDTHSKRSDSVLSPSQLPINIPVDILVLDVEMPTFSGLELCQVIRADARFQSIPILFLTKHQAADWRSQAYRAGGDDFIHKAIAPAELAIRLRNQLKRACRL